MRDPVTVETFEGAPTPRPLVVIKILVGSAVIVAILWSAGRDLLGYSGSSVGTWVFRTFALAASYFVFIGSIWWIDRRYACRVTATPAGIEVTTARHRRFDIPWSEVTETVGYRLPFSRFDYERCLRLRSRHVPYVLMTERLRDFDRLVARIRAETPHARHDARRTLLEYLLGARGHGLGSVPPSVS